MRALVTGATGLIGAALVDHLETPTVLTRSPGRLDGALARASVHAWDPMAQRAPSEALSGVDVVFHLAGEPIAGGPWTRARRRRIRDSRVVGTRNLIAGLAAVEPRPRALVSASAVGFYGDRGDEELDERSGRGAGFLAEVCAEWEAEATAASALGMRVVCARIGVVLARRGGALATLLRPLRLGVGGKVGSGTQWMSWIHQEDLVGLLLHAATTPRLTGPVNAVAPHPVTNAVFTDIVARQLRRPAVVPVPGAALRLALGELADVILGSQRALPRAALESGYEFVHPTVGAALAALLAEDGEPRRATEA